MIALAGLVYLPRWAIAAVASRMIAGHNLLDGIDAAHVRRRGLAVERAAPAGAARSAAPEIKVFALYPLIPWIGVMAAGYALGPVMLLAPAQRRRWLIGLGVAR